MLRGVLLKIRTDLAALFLGQTRRGLLKQFLEGRDLFRRGRIADVLVSGHDVGVGYLLALRVQKDIERQAGVFAA